MLTWLLDAQLPDGQRSTLALRTSVESTWARVAGEVLDFVIPDGKHLYLTSSGDTGFARPPETTPFALQPGAAYVLAANVTRTGGSAAVWLIEYDQQQRLRHRVRELRSPQLTLAWTTHPELVSWRLAVRLAGTGQLRWGPLVVQTGTAGQTPRPPPEQTRPLRSGPQGRFARPSIFFDPSGYRAYTERHHRFYDHRGPDWYAPVVRRLQGCRRVLDVGCGPGLLLQALGQAGVGYALGLERDPEFLAACRARGVLVRAHDLNLPFPFLVSDDFDGVVAHHSLDYLAPIAIRGVLRECHRVLKGDGLLVIASRCDGAASGDPTRTVPLHAALLQQFLTEAGFEALEVSTRDRCLSALARRPTTRARWPRRRVHLRSGVELHPWGERRALLAPQADTWDNASNRDFVVLGDAAKREVRHDGQLVAYFTGYHVEGGATERAVCRAVSTDGRTWLRSPELPVLRGGACGATDEGGVAAGSVLRLPAGARATYVMYYSPRAADGQWPGIARAWSHDGISWEKEPGLVLSTAAYPGLRHLALADVIQTSDGRWLMHCEGWLSAAGWAVFQARSDDGLRWERTRPEPILDPRDISWGRAHAANPKCVEPWPGQFLLGFNAAGDALEFQLGLAESRDALRWHLVAVDPVVCTRGGEYRVESMFMTVDGWRDGRQRLYFFAAASRHTHVSSRLLTAEADPDSGWVDAPWQTDRPGRYRISAAGLCAEPGPRSTEHALAQHVDVTGELQCSLRIRGGGGDGGGATLEWGSDACRWVVGIDTSGRCTIDGVVVQGANPTAKSIAACLRVLRPLSPGPEFTLQAWHDDALVLEHQGHMPFTPRRLTVALAAAPDGQPMVVDHCDLWQPEARAVEAGGDAQMYMGSGVADDPLLPDVDAAQLARVLEQHAIGRALVMPYGAARRRDGFDQIHELARQRPGQVYPLLRLRPLPDPQDAEHQFQVDQLELLWQMGRMYGLKFHMASDERPAPGVLEWLEQRQALSLWHVAVRPDLDWLNENVLARYTFPVLLSHFGGYPLDRERYARAIALLDRFDQLYLVSSAVWFRAYLEEAIRRHPHRILFGSDFPAVDPSAARATVERLAVSETAKALVLSENLRFLTDRAAWFRWQALQQVEQLRFPPVPATPDDVVKQGFQVVPPGEFPPTEFDAAKDFWSQYEVKPWYQAAKPWARLLADLVADLQPDSVLEFGCNVGRNLAAIAATNPGVRLAGIDINREAVEVGRRETGLDLRYGDERTLAAEEGGAFDLVFTVSVLDHIADIRDVCRALVRCARQYLFLLEVTLPVEGKVLYHLDHRARELRATTGASYSWDVAKYLRSEPRLRRLDARPCYLHNAMLGPYYWSYLAFLDPNVA
jgi:SAM-dependent methyltransferase/predicted TIM-barrel fold metal-dependent hydrolase